MSSGRSRLYHPRVPEYACGGHVCPQLWRARQGQPAVFPLLRSHRRSAELIPNASPASSQQFRPRRERWNDLFHRQLERLQEISPGKVVVWAGDFNVIPSRLGESFARDALR